MRVWRTVVLTLVALCTVPALAHALAPRYDLPLPLWHYLAGATASVALSFAVVARARRRLSARAWSVALPLPACWQAAALGGLRGGGSALLILVLAAGFFGPIGDWDANLLPVTVWVLWWVGMAFACATVAGLWRAVDPWQAVAGYVVRSRAAAWQEGRPPRREPFGGCASLHTVWRRHTRRRSGARHCGPALAFFLAFAWAELVWSGNAQPRALAALVLAWSLLSWAGMAWLGRVAWRRRCDPFDRFFGLLGRLAPLTLRRQPGGLVLQLRWPGAGLASSRLPSASETTFIITMLATVGFDGLNETPAWELLTAQALSLMYSVGLVQLMGYGLAGALVKTAGLLGAPALWAAFYLGACVLTAPLAGEGALRVARRFAYSLVPIALAYHLAHYLSYLLIQGQAALPAASDPFGLGWDLFGTRGREIDIGIIEMRTVWAVAVVSIVVGHVVAVFVAHAQAQRAYGERALHSQWPLIALMLAYTASSLWILSQPIVEGG